MLARVIQDPEHALDNRLQALKLLVGQRASGVLVDLLPLAVSLEDGPILAAVLDQLSTRREPAAGPMLVRRASSPDAEVRAAAVRAIGQLQWADARETVQMMLKDQDPRVRRDAAAAAARLQLSSAGDELVLLARDSDVFVQEASINALRHLRDARALPAALDCMIRAETHSAAIAYVAQFGNPQHATVIAETARRNPSCEVLGPSVSVLTRWADDATVSGEIRAKLNSDVTKLQGASGELIRWRTRDLIESDSLEQLLARIGKSVQPFDWRHESNNWISTVAQPVNGSFLVRMDKNASGGWVGLSDIFVSETTNAQFLTSSDGGLRVWVNGERVFQRDQPSPFLIDSDRFTASLKPGLNRVLIHVSASNATTFHMRFRPVSSRSEHEQLIQAALSRSGSIERGAKVFLDAEKSQCLKCHRLDERGEKVGPELTGVGDRFSRIHIIESILDPSRTLAPSFEAVTVGLKDGRVLSGLRIAESESTLTLVDNQAVRHTVAKSAIEQQRAQVTSIMPDGLEKRFTLDEFVDLVSFLVSQKSTAASGR
jgi:putative heme-binding domain-containing protein